MEFMLILSEDSDLIATEDQRRLAVQEAAEYALGLVGDGILKGGALLHGVIGPAWACLAHVSAPEPFWEQTTR